MSTYQKLWSIVLLLPLSVVASNASADMFGTGTNTFEIEFVSIGNPNNPDDVTGAPNPVGKVEYSFRMGKYEISESMIAKANAAGGLSITTSARGPDKPATQVSWFEAATFVNWLNSSKGHTPAYKFNSGTFELWQPGDSGYNPDNPFRNAQAFYFLPSVDEWYKSAYYDAAVGVYYDYPTGSDAEPDGIDFIGDPNFDAIFVNTNLDMPPHDITDVGVLSPYGTAGQGGNVWEWEETAFDLVNDSTSEFRGNRGGSWVNNSLGLLSGVRRQENPFNSPNAIGFRVASVPEPSTIVFTVLALGSLVAFRARANRGLTIRPH